MPLRLEPVRDRKLYRLAKSVRTQPTRKGEVIFRCGDPGGQVFLVREGHVCLRLGADRGALTAAVAGPSELFGEEGMIPGALRPFNALAGAPGSVLPLEGAAVRGVLRTSQHTLTTYLEAKEWELRLLRSAAAGSPGPSARQRLAAVLLDLFERLGGAGGRARAAAALVHPPGACRLGRRASLHGHHLVERLDLARSTGYAEPVPDCHAAVYSGAAGRGQRPPSLR